jgi:hypothetical protein
MGLFRKSENEKRLSGAGADLVTARAKLSAIDAKEGDAIVNGATFATWQNERAAAATELDRLERLIAALQAGGEAARQHDLDEAFRIRMEAARKNNTDVAERLRTEGAQLAAAMKALARDVAASQVETAAINRALPSGTPPLQDANNLARGRPGVPRQDISEKMIDLWCRATDGGLIGEQDAVVPVDTQTGHLFINKTRVDCVKRKFRSVQYNPDVWSEIPEPFHSTLRIPNFDRQGADFDGQRMIEEQVAAVSVEPPPATEKKSRRPVQTELIAVEAWEPPTLNPVGSI